MKVELVEVVFDKGQNPLAVSFENGKISDGLESKLKCKLCRNSRKNLVTAYTKKMLYMGEICPDEDLQYNFLVIKKKNSDKVRLINIDHVSLRPHIEQENGLLDSTITGEKVTSADLNKQFGSKKTKRNTEQKERLKLDIENVKEQLEQTVAAIKTDDYFLNNSQTTETESAYTPPINRDASVIEQVYRLETLIPPDVIDALEVEVNTILSSDDFDNLDLFGSCKQNIRDLMDNALVGKNLERMKIYVYIHYLLKFLATPVKNMSKKYVLCNTSKEIDFNILNNFSLQSGSNRTRPMSMRDKTICHVLVLAMLASNYDLDLEVLSKDLKLGIKKLHEMSRILAFTTNGPKTATMKLPLPAPVTFNLKRKR